MKRSLILLPFLLVALPAWGQTKQLPYSPCRTPVVELRVDTPMVERGSAPTFTLVLRNDEREPIRVLDVRNRPDLQDTYCEVKFLRGGKVLDLPMAVSDPDPLAPNGKSHLTLQPGREERFKINYVADPTDLRPGIYEAVVVFWNFDLPPAPSSQRCLSNRVKFTVK